MKFEINVRAIPLSLDDGSSGLNVIMTEICLQQSIFSMRDCDCYNKRMAT